MHYLSSLNTLFTSLVSLVVANTAFTQTEIGIIQDTFGLDKKVAIAIYR